MSELKLTYVEIEERCAIRFDRTVSELKHWLAVLAGYWLAGFDRTVSELKLAKNFAADRSV